jgi:hypothetical protein
MADVRLDTPYVTVLMADGTSYTVRVLNPDYLRWDRTAAKHGWPPMAKAPHTWLTFVAWAALRREDRIGSTWEDFSEKDCVQVANATPESNGAVPADVLAAVGLSPSEVASLSDLADGVDPTPRDPEPA